eukprot:5073178-Prymnesium_polylepis.1
MSSSRASLSECTRTPWLPNGDPAERDSRITLETTRHVHFRGFDDRTGSHRSYNRCVCRDSTIKRAPVVPTRWAHAASGSRSAASARAPPRRSRRAWAHGARVQAAPSPEKAAVRFAAVARSSTAARPAWRGLCTGGRRGPRRKRARGSTLAGVCVRPAVRSAGMIISARAGWRVGRSRYLCRDRPAHRRGATERCDGADGRALFSAAWIACHRRAQCPSVTRATEACRSVRCEAGGNRAQVLRPLDDCACA